MKKRLKIESYSHGIRVSGYDRDILVKLHHFLQKFILKEPKKVYGGPTIMEEKKRFFGITNDNRNIHLHIRHRDLLVDYLSTVGITRDYIEFEEIKVPKPVKADLKVRKDFEPREEQWPVISAASDETPSRAIFLQTGKGKTACSLYTASLLGYRTLIMIPPKYFGIWESAINELYEDIDGRYVVASGTGEIKALIERTMEKEIEPDIILLSSVTYRNYLENYERFPNGMEELGYHVPPPRFHEALGVGLQINDEIQDDPGLVFRTDLYTNVKKQLYLSATPYTGNEFVTKMLETMLPAETQCPLPELDVYIDVIALVYSEPGITRKMYQTPQKGSYNHGRYETQMLKKKRRTQRYQEMVKKMVNGLYVQDREPGQKMLILCYTVEFIKILTQYLQEQYPDLAINYYVSGVSYEILEKSDIIVSTIKSAGTGVDISNIREVLLLQATDSKKDNIQVLGRLRRMKDWPDHTPRFSYAVCEDIPPHVRYHKNKQSHFAKRVLSHRIMRV